MRKHSIFAIFLSVFILTAGLCAYAAQVTKFSNKFIKNFEDCDTYSETSSSEFQGKTFTSERKIIGWRNGVCRYQETLKSQDGGYLIDCAFTSIQLDEIYSAMKDKSKEPIKHDLEIFSQQTDPKTGNVKYVPVGTTGIKGNKAYVVWAKYQNNPYFCTAKKL